MFDDPIVAETRSIREAYAASFGYDLGKIIADLASRQGKDGRLIIDRTAMMQPDERNESQRPGAVFPDDVAVEDCR